MVSGPGLAGDAGPSTDSRAVRLHRCEQGRIERPAVDVPSMPERIEHEIGCVEVGATPSAAVCVGGPVIGGAEDPGAEEVIEHALGARREALARRRRYGAAR